MANKTISALTPLNAPPNANDVVPINDVALGVTKKVTVANLVAATAVEGTAILSTGESGGTRFLREDGDNSCSWNAVEIGAEQLRGTANPHMGAFPNQSLLVTDNPSGAAVVVTNANGSLDFVVNSDSARVYLNKPSAREELTTGVSVREDTAEPDIEITTASGVYSLISGDSDALGVNGLPIRQGFGNPDMGAFPSPLLISGGSIS